jgi:hypothetical protein
MGVGAKEMVIQIITVVGILSGTLLLSTLPIGLLALAEPSPFDQQVIIWGSDARHYKGYAPFITGSRITDYNIGHISTTSGFRDGIATPSSNTTQAISTILAVDLVNSTYIAPKTIDEGDSDRRIGRAIRDRVNDIAHTMVRSNATIISNATITNSYHNESATTNNYTRFLEIIPDNVSVALEEIRRISPPSQPDIEIHSDIEISCIPNNDSLGECDINLRIH